MRKMDVAQALAKIGKEEGVIPGLWENLPWGDSDFGQYFLAHEELSESITDDEVIFINNVFLGESILDVGCGGGRSLAALLEKTSNPEYISDFDGDFPELIGTSPDLKITGIDLSCPPLLEATQRVPSGCFAQADMVSLPFREQSFDGLISLFGSWISLTPSDFCKFLKESFRVLSDDSLIVLEAPSCESLEALHGVKEWSVTDSSFAGNFPQLLLSENIISTIDINPDEANEIANTIHCSSTSQSVYVRKEYVVNLSNGELKTYCQFYALYKPEELVDFLTKTGFHSAAIYGGFDGSVPDEYSERIVVIGHK